MYGDNVHKAVLANNETESGITIHFVNEHFDEGETIHQAKFKIEPGDTLDTIKLKGQQLEHQHFPKVIEGLLKKVRSIILTVVYIAERHFRIPDIMHRR